MNNLPINMNNMSQFQLRSLWINQFYLEFYSIYNFYQFKHFLHIWSKILLVQITDFSIHDCADVCYADIIQEFRNKMDRLLNSYICFIYGVVILSTSPHIAKSRNGSPYASARIWESSLHYFIINDPCAPECLKSKFKYLGGFLYRIRSDSKFTLSHRTGFVSNSFSLLGNTTLKCSPTPYSKSAE